MILAIDTSIGERASSVNGFCELLHDLGRNDGALFMMPSGTHATSNTDNTNQTLVDGAAGMAGVARRG